MPPLSKDSLRSAALAARKAYVATLSDAQRARLEAKLARRLTALCANATVVGGYAAIGSEISVLAAMEEARSVGSIGPGGEGSDGTTMAVCRKSSDATNVRWEPCDPDQGPGRDSPLG